MKTIKIFIASSKELVSERKEMAVLANSLNTVLEKLGVQVIAVEWENVDASKSVNHDYKQEDYNDRLRECDMCMVLYWTIFGIYTREELDTAVTESKAGHNPRKLYVYFKENGEPEKVPTQELKEFRDSFPTQYGHFYTPFSNFDTLKAHFLLQFMEYQSQILQVEIKEGKIIIGDKEYVDLKNVPFAGNNEEYNSIKKSIEDKENILKFAPKDNPVYSETEEELSKLREKLSKMESNLWDTALMITRLSTTKCSERLKRAMDLFTSGDNKGAQAVLNEEEIERDVEHNLHLIELGEEGVKGLVINIEEYRLKIKTIENELQENWSSEAERLFEVTITCADKLREKDLLCAVLNDYSIFLRKLNRFTDCITQLKRVEQLGFGSSVDKYDVYRRLGEAYCWIKAFHDGEVYYDNAIDIAGDDTWKKINCLVGKSNIYFGKDKDKAEQMYREALNLCKNCLSTESDYIAYAQILNNLGNICTKKGNFAEAESFHLESLECRKNHANDDEDGQNEAAYSLKNLGDLYLNWKKLDQAKESYQKAIEIRRYLCQRNPEVHESHLSMCLNGLGKVLMDQDDYENSFRVLSEALEIRKRLAQKDKKAYDNYVARSLNYLAQLYMLMGEFPKAEEKLNESFGICQKLYEEDAAFYSQEYTECIDLIVENYKRWGTPEKADYYKSLLRNKE